MNKKEYQRELTKIIKQKNKEIDKLTELYSRTYEPEENEKTAETQRKPLSGEAFKKYLKDYGINK